MNCLSENEGKKTEKKNGKNTLVFTNELPNWKGKKNGKNNFSIHKWIAWLKTNTKGKKNGKKMGKTSWRTLLRGGFINFSRELAYFIVGGFINAMWTYT